MKLLILTCLISMLLSCESLIERRMERIDEHYKKDGVVTDQELGEDSDLKTVVVTQNDTLVSEAAQKGDAVSESKEKNKQSKIFESEKSAQKSSIPVVKASLELEKNCMEELLSLPGPVMESELSNACSKVQKIKSCESVNKRPIYHYSKTGSASDGKRVLVFAVVHGDEQASGSVARHWMERLEKIDPRSSWRIVPVLNPDGLIAKQRPNANGVDINRNFPTKDWEHTAHGFWKERNHKSSRKFPGAKAASEPETKCAVAHIQDFNPDLIVAIHTPYGLLDFDGPIVQVPPFKMLPWKRLGHMPGSLGRYMWKDHNVPVLTIELNGGSPVKQIHQINHMQDMVGTLAIRADKRLN